VAQERRTVDDLAAAILDGTPVDWDAAETTSPGPDSELIRYLRVVARVADAYRAGSSAEPGTPGDRTRPPLRVVRPDETWGHLRLLEHIGSGAFGDVYRAWDSKLDREVALKLLATPTADKGTTVIQEGSLLARIRHPNVVTVFGADQFDGKVGLWMELIKGRALADLLVDQGPLSAHEAALAGASVCRALSAVHRAGLLHRDIKAQNVMREDGGRVLLMDFGTGRLALEAPRTPEPSGLAGTPMYLAPELFGGAEPTAQSDIYSVGVLLFQLVTRTYPVHGHTLRGLRAAHATGRRKYLRDERPDLADAFVRVVEKAIAPDPAARFESAGAMEAALAAVVVAPETIATAPAAPLPRARPDSRRRSRAWMAAMATGLVAAVAAALVWRGIGREASGHATQAGGGAGGSTPVAVPALANSVVVRKVPIPGGYATGRPSPDGRLFSFSDETGNLAVVEMATGNVRRLTAAEPDVEYATASALSADGRRAAYAWQALDGRAELRVVGTDGKRTRVLLRQDDVEGARPFEWARDGSAVLCDLDDARGAHRLALVDTSAAEVRVVAELGTAAPWHASLSPDGRFVAFDGPLREDNPTRDVFIVGADGADRRALIAHPANDHSPVWTHDGRRVLFVSDRSGAMDVWAVDVEDGVALGQPNLVHRGIGRILLLGLTDAGSYYYESIEGAVDVYTADLGATRIERAAPVGSTYTGSNLSSAWSPDGRRIAYASRRSMVGFDRHPTTLVIHDLDANEGRAIVPAVSDGMVSGWSLDGKQVLLHGYDSKARGGVYGIDVETGRMTPLVMATRTDDASIGRGEWMPDGERILYRRRQALWWRHLQHQADEMALDWRAEKIQGINGGGMGRGYKASPDGGSIAFSGIVGGGEDANGTSLRIKTLGQPSREIFRVNRPEIVVFQDWMPDGRSLLFTKAHVGQKQSLWQIPVEGGQPTPLPLGMGVRDVSVSPDGQRITFTSGAPLTQVWALENFFQ
jgi:serine/threonine-protein kinase